MGALERRLDPGYVAHVLIVWILMTGVVGVLALNSVLFWDYFEFWNSTAFVGLQLIIGPALVGLLGVYVARQSKHPWVAAFGTLLVLFASISIIGGCGTTLCEIPEGYEHWRNVRFGIETSTLGPILLVTTDPVNCGFTCSGTYPIRLAPLVAGYVLLGPVMSPELSGFSRSGAK